MGSAGERPARGGQVLRQQVRSRLDEPLVIERDAPLQPVRAGHRARHGEDMPNAVRLEAPGLVVAPAHALEVTVALEAHDLRMRVADDSWMVLDAPDQVARHGVGQPRRANHHVHPPGGLGQERGGLARGVAGAHDDHFFTGAQLRLHKRGGVIHARALELREVVDLEAPILRSRRDDHRACRQPVPIADLERVRRTAAGEPTGPGPDHQLGPELLCLAGGAGRELQTADPGGKAEVVLDPRARAGLASGSGRLDDQDIQAFRRPVHGRGEPRGSRPHDDQVAELGLIDRVVEAQRIGDLLIGRVRSTTSLQVITTGMSAAVTWKRSSSSWTPASRSRSSIVWGCPLRVRNSRTRSVPLQCGDPRTTTSLTPRAINSSRRRMKARMKRVLSSLSVWMSASRSSRLTSMTSLSIPARTWASPRRPDNMVASPVNIPGLKDITTSSVADGRMTSIRPARTTKIRATLSPAWTSTSPCATWRRRPCGAMRASCAGVTVG